MSTFGDLLLLEQLGVCNSGGVIPIVDQILAFPGLFALWELAETAGSTADNAEGTAARDGAYIGSPTLANAAFPVGGTSHALFGANQGVHIYTAALASAFDATSGWLYGWFRDADPSGAGVNDPVIRLYTDFDNQIYMHRDAAFRYDVIMRRGGDQAYSGPVGVAGAHWHQIAVSYDNTADAMITWLDGWQWSSVAMPASAWAGALLDTANTLMCATQTGTGALAGHGGMMAMGFGSPLTNALVSNAYDAVYPSTESFLFCGDSKTEGDHWPSILCGLVSDATSLIYREKSDRIATAGWTAAQLHTGIDAQIGSVVGSPAVAIIDIGSNDVAAGTSEVDFKAALNGCIEGIRTKSSIEKIYITFPWRKTYNAECATLKTWIEDIIAAESDCYAGPDQNVWYENGDDGATYSSDGTHFNDAGNNENAAQLYTSLGYS